jgi:hypothetical protein
VEGGAGGPHLGWERPGQGGGKRFEHRHLETPTPGRSRHLGADEAGADDTDTAGRLEFPGEGEALVERPQHVDAGQVGRVWDPAGCGPGGDHEAVVAQRLPVIESHGPLGDVKGGGPSP